MGEGVLYRSSSPVNPELGRNGYADAAIKAAGVKTIVNLADNSEDIAGYEGYASTYYAGQKVITLGLGVDFQAADFQAGLAEGLRFIAANEGPYLIHCTEGKDRAGFVSALLECFMGASYEEVVADYMVTYYNYYRVKPGTEKYAAIAESNIIKSLQAAFGVTDLTTADLKAEAAEYLKAIGLTDGELAALAANLASAPQQSETYVVVAGDSLWKIAKNLYGKGSMWKVLFEANQDTVKNPNRIYVGQVLTIPEK
jgi:protein tyrosine/serine phosphatase